MALERLRSSVVSADSTWEMILVGEISPFSREGLGETVLLK